MLSIKRKLTLSTTSGSLLPFVCFTAFYLEKVFTQNYVYGSPQYFKHSWTITKYFLPSLCIIIGQLSLAE